VLQGKKQANDQGNYALLRADTNAELNEEEIAPSQEAKSAIASMDRRKAFMKQVILQILCATFFGFVAIANLALVPIFLGTEQPSTNIGSGRVLGGGFGLNTENTSHILLTQAISSILYQIFVIPTVVEKVGTLRSYRFALIL
jgi:hypothetical protein